MRAWNQAWMLRPFPARSERLLAPAAAAPQAPALAHVGALERSTHWIAIEVEGSGDLLLKIDRVQTVGALGGTSGRIAFKTEGVARLKRVAATRRAGELLAKQTSPRGRRGGARPGTGRGMIGRSRTSNE